MATINAKRAAAAGIGVLIIGLLVSARGHVTWTHPPQTIPGLSQTAPADRDGILQNYGKLPLRFESNLGQVHGASEGEVKFLSRGQGYALFLTRADAVLKLRAPGTGGHESQGRETNGASLQMKLVGANPRVTVQGTDELPGRSNYFIGNDPSQWHTGVPNYAGVRYRGVYPGVDLVYYGNQGQLEYDFIIAPGADPDVIRLDVGAQQPAPLRIDRDGDLVVQANGGEVRFRKPVVYQPTTEAAARSLATATGPSRQQNALHSTRVETRYRLEGNHRVRFEIGEYDRTRPLVIDPTLSYSSYLGGSSLEQGFGIAVDASGNAYVTGCTGSPDFPATTGSDQPNIAGGGDCGTVDGAGDAFVAKVNSTGTALIYATYLGGSGGDQGLAIAADAAGNAYVTGMTASGNFPFTPGAAQTTSGGGDDLFVTKLNPTGSALVYSTYLGGSADEGFYGAAIAVDASGNVYVTGDTASANFPLTAGAFQTTCTPCSSGGYNSFITKLNAAGSALIYSTFLGGSGGGLGDVGKGIAVDASGNAYVAGEAYSLDFPHTTGAFQSACVYNAGVIGYVSKLNDTGSALVYSTLLCGSENTKASGIAIDSSGNAYVTGHTESSDLLITPGAFQATCPSYNTIIHCDSAFVLKLNPTGSAPVYFTYLGGSTQDYANGIAVDSSGNAYVIGTTYSVNFPTTTGSFQPNCSGGCLLGDAFMTELNSTGTALVYSTLYGGAGIENGNQIALDANGNVYIAGTTGSTDLHVTPGVFQPQCVGCANNSYAYTDAFVAKFSFGSGPSPVTTTTTLAVSPISASAGASVTLTATVTPASGTTAPTGMVTFTDGTTTLGTGALSSAGIATYSTSSLAVGSHSITASYGGDTGDSASTSGAVRLLITPSGPSPVMTSSTLAVSPTSATAGAAVTLTATVTPASGTTAPTGTVTFKDGATTLGTGTLSGTGIATFSTSSLAVGTHSLTASYGGDAGDSASTSTPSSLMITGAAAPAAPTGATATAGNAQVTLSWTASSGAATYNVYQGTSAGGESTTAIQTGIIGTSAVVGALTNGSTYYFTIAAVNSNGTSAASSEANATPTAPTTAGGGGSGSSGHGGGGALGSNALLALLLLTALRVWRTRLLPIQPIP
jgi:hypothetical protein